MLFHIFFLSFPSRLLIYTESYIAGAHQKPSVNSICQRELLTVRREKSLNNRSPVPDLATSHAVWSSTNNLKRN